MASETVQCMPACFRRWPMALLAAHFEHTELGAQADGAELWVAHAVAVGADVGDSALGFVPTAVAA